MNSIWQDGEWMPSFPKLQGDLHTDILVIGGGMAGVLCAYTLQQAGESVVLVERRRLGQGVTGGTTAKITAQHGLCYHKLLRRFGKEQAKLYLQANLDAVETFWVLGQSNPCQIEEKPSIVYSRTGAKPLSREMEALEKLGAPARWVSGLPLPFPTVGGICFPHQAQFHPLRFLAALAQSLQIYEQTPVLELGDGWAKTAQGTIHAEKILVATHFPMLNKHGSYFLKLYQSRTYMLALDHGEPLDGMYLDCQTGGLTLRSYGNVLLLGGYGGRTGTTCGDFEKLERDAAAYYPHSPVLHRWAAQDCMSLDGVPYIGRYSAGTPNLYVATGFQKWGMTGSMVAANLLCDLIQGRESPYAQLFSPSRGMLHLQLLSNGFHAVGNLMTPGKPRCPHMGCKLKWNAQEHTWDCPCHGSRFLPDGTCMENPSNGDLPNPPPEPQNND